MRGFAMALAVAGVTFASASFELGLVADAGTGSVQRFDMDSGTYLGSFGQGILLGPQQIIVDSASNTAVVWDTGNTTIGFDYNTGAVKWYNAAAGTIGLTAGPDGNFYSCYNGTGIRSYSFSTGAFVVNHNSGVSGAQITAAVKSDDGYLFFFNNANDTVYSSLVSSTSTALAAGLFQTVTKFSPGVGDFLGLGTSPAGTSGINMMKVIPGGLVSQSNSYAIPANISAPTQAAGGHVHRYLVGKNPSNLAQGIVGRYDSNLGVRGAFGTGTLVNPTGIAIVNAPEPASFAALGLGLAVLARRKRLSG